LAMQAPKVWVFSLNVAENLLDARPFPPRGCYRRALLQSHRHALLWCYQSEGEMP
jgi:hypothetical protein